MRRHASVLCSLLCLLICSVACSFCAENNEKLVSILTPGFRVQELPIHLSNVDNLRFSPDGLLTAICYDGHIYSLQDTDADGLEDKVSPFWDRDTLTVPVGAYWAREGLYVSSKGKISLLRDTNNDGQADREEVLSTNWPPTEAFSGNVDATSITEDKDGDLYFGLLTENYANPYRVRDGVSHYNLNGKRGTIQKFHRSTGKSETIATGIRVPYQLAFNKAGDLFVTDQEGETWCPNGNPLDELNHIIPGKNYGFPPRHPQYLPNLISEPPVVAFGPQHQSACGFVFNEPSRSRKLFGPASWEDEALVAGESRGKVWRVQLSKTPFGYIGREILFARLRMLTTDVVISPKGELYVSCHSGLPDWGTGPKGEGKIFKITYTDTATPLPIAAWAGNPMEVRIAFDKPIPVETTNLVSEMQIDFGEYVRPADRLENLKPPYKVVSEQEATPRGKLKVVAAVLSEDQRTLILTTDPHPASVSYAIAIPWIRTRDPKGAPTRIDLAYDLNGVEAAWTPQDKPAPSWSGWFPHLDSEANRTCTLDSAEHEKFYSISSQPGNILFRTQLIPPPGTIKYTFMGSAPFRIDDGSAKFSSSKRGTNFVLELPVRAGVEVLPTTVEIETGSMGKLEFHVAYNSSDDPNLRPLPFSGVRLPWAPPHTKPPPVESATQLATGDYESGRGLFFSEGFKCATCHSIHEQGGKIGPDLSNLPQRDAASVLRDIRDPNATMNPDFVAYNVTLKNGEQLTGFLHAQSPTQLRLVDVTGKETLISRLEIQKQEVSSVSLMPSGLLDNRKESEITDLITFLCNEPPPRKSEEVRAILESGKNQNEPANVLRDLHIVLVASKQDHGPGQHDYPNWQTNFNAFLSRSPKTEVENAWEWPSEEQFAKANAIVFYYWNHDWTTRKFAEVDQYLGRGGGVTVIHSATISDKSPEDLARRIGLAAQPVTVKYAHTPIDLNFVALTNNLITAGFSALHLLDEPYWPMIGDTNNIQVLATAIREGVPCPMMWTFEKGKGRVFASIPGHYTWTHEDPMFRIIALRGIAWCARENPSRFLHLVEESLPK